MKSNPIYFILLADGFRAAADNTVDLGADHPGQQASQTNGARPVCIGYQETRTAQRSERNQAFLGAVYQFEDEDLRVALAEIDKCETEVFAGFDE